jgi:CcmD family protein
MKQDIPFVVGAYMAIWIVLFAYVLINSRRLSNLQKELGALSKAFEKKSQ